MLKSLLSGAAVLALSGHAALASNVIINGVPHQAGQTANISYGSGAIGCCETTELSHTLPVIHPSTVGSTTYTSVPTVTHQAAPAVVHQAAPAVTYQTAPAVTYTAPVITHQAAPIVTHQAAPVAPRHEVIINQLPAPAAPVVAAPIVAAPVVKAKKPAARGWNSRVYVGARGGVSFARDTDFNVQGLNVENEYDDPGYTVSGVVGWAAKVNNNIRYRLEAELGYQAADVDRHVAQGVAAARSQSNGDTETIFGFVNAYADIPVINRLNATLGAGLGVGYVSFDGHGTTGLGTLLDDSDTAFGYHLDAGLSYDVTEQLALEALYRYTSFVDVELTAVDGTSSDTNVDSHNVLVGARYGF